MDNQDLFSVRGKHVLLTGGTRGLGYGLAEGFARAGARLVITGTSERVFDAAKALAGETGGDVRGTVARLDEAEHVDAFYRQALEQLDGRLDVLVNSAGIQHRCPAERFPMEEWNKILQVNLTAVFRLCQLAAGTMLEQAEGGKIINIASMTSFFGSEGIPAYTASKGAVMQLTKALSNEWAGRGIQVNAIAPGYMETELTESMKAYNPGQYEQVTQRIPMHRWGRPEDLQGAALFLASRASDYVSGVTLPVDGGYLGK